MMMHVGIVSAIWFGVLSTGPLNVNASSFDLVLDGGAKTYSTSEYPRLSDLGRLLPSQVPLDGLLWLRSSHVQQQAELQASCASDITNVGFSMLPRDLVVRDKGAVRRSLLRLVETLAPTGRVLEYGSLDPVDLDASDFLDRRLRDGDMFVWAEKSELVWTWDYFSGWREQAHRPVNSAWHYSRGVIKSEAVRGDWAYVIAPSGALHLTGLGGHNMGSNPVAPGSMIFYPPPGLGRGNHRAYGCIAQYLRTQHPTLINAKPWWRRQ
jgi:hypothetical protein